MPSQFLRLLQLASPTLPVGAYSYSEGLETLVDQGAIATAPALQTWIAETLTYGMRIDGAVLVRAYRGYPDPDALNYWNQWLSAVRETAELRRQSRQMGRSLWRLLEQIDPTVLEAVLEAVPEIVLGEPGSRGAALSAESLNWTVGFGLAAAHWQIDLHTALLAFYQSWASNLIGAGVKLIPLGQTAGQQLLFNLTPQIAAIATAVTKLRDDDLVGCSWGLALASSQHETQRVRLFQS